MQISIKHLVFYFFILVALSSCRAKITYNGSETLKCRTFKEPKNKSNDKKNSKYEIIVLKDGKRVGKKPRKKRRGKSSLFKKR